MISYQFGDWLIEPELGRIRRQKVCRHLQPQTLHVLSCLLERAGEVVSQAALLKVVWHDRIVEASAVPRNIAIIRRALGDAARHPRYIETIPKLGYRTLAPVTLVRSPQRTLAIDPHSTSGVLLAVLPFDNPSSDPDLADFSEGVSEQVIHTVARETPVEVIPRSSRFGLPSGHESIRLVADEWGCSHVLDGAVRSVDERIRVSAKLIDCTRKATTWTGEFERDLKDAVTLQNEFATAVTRVIGEIRSTQPA